jgi:hypothetical protein
VRDVSYVYRKVGDEFIRLTDYVDGTLSLNLNFELSPEEVSVMAPGAEDFSDKVRLCKTYVQNFLQTHSVQQLKRHLSWRLEEAKAGRYPKVSSYTETTWIVRDE